MRVEFPKSSLPFLQCGYGMMSGFNTYLSYGLSQPAWVFEDDKITCKKQVFCFNEIESISFFEPLNKSLLPSIKITMKGNKKLERIFFFSRREPYYSRGKDVYEYILKIVETNKTQEKTIIEEELKKQREEKLKTYKRQKTSMIDENLEELKQNYGKYVLNFLASLNDKDGYITSPASEEEILNSCDELKVFATKNKEDFESLLKYLCDNREIIKMSNSIGVTRYRLRSSLHKDPNMNDEKLEIKILFSLKDKEEEYVYACDENYELKDAYKLFNQWLNKYSSSILNAPMLQSKPLSSTSATLLGNAIGGTSLGIVKGIEAQEKMNDYYQNRTEYYSSKGNQSVNRSNVEKYFYQIESFLYQYEDVYADWMREKKTIINK